MANSIQTIGAGWVTQVTAALTDHIERVSPSEFSERYRYLPDSVTSMPGPMRWDVNPFMREIVDCFDIDSPVREVNVKKGVQITYTTLLESGLLYLMAHVKTAPVMFMTADKELAAARIENNILPMVNHSGFDIIRSSDTTSKRKTGKTKDHIQWEGGGYLVPFGAKNADKMRSYSILALLKDEIDAWDETVGKDGDPDALSDARCAAYWEVRKIFRGSTPLVKGSSKIEKAYLRGDQRKYFVRCLGCGFSQILRWSGRNKETGKDFGLAWELEGGVLITDSVRYICANCGHGHQEFDKEKLFATDHGARWEPTVTAVAPDIRSYHLPGYYSPAGMTPWYKQVIDYLEAYDPVEKRVRDIGRFQVFYNNVLAEPFEVMGEKVTFVAVSAHRRPVYRLGEIPNDYAARWSGSKILFLTCQVDAHKSNLAVSVMGWTRDARCYLIDYWRFEDDSESGCADANSPAWGQLRALIDEKTYTANDGIKYGIAITVIDAGWAPERVGAFCEEYEAGVYPVIGRSLAGAPASIKEFSEFTMQSGTVGYQIRVDYYKDRLAAVLRRYWVEEMGKQSENHFNAPVDLGDKPLTELTVERKREKKDPRGQTTYEWYRPGNAPNELWDLLVYGHAAVEILAWLICVKHFEAAVDWAWFWSHWENGLTK